MKATTKIENILSRIPDNRTFKYENLNLNSDEYTAAAKAIERLIKTGKIKRLSRGIFYKPKKTVFGDILPDDRELIKPYLFKNNKRIAYITGTALFNKFGLSTQIPKTISIASNIKKIYIVTEKITAKPAKSYVSVTNGNYKFLEILDVINKYKTIPDIDNNVTINFLLNKLNSLSNKDKQKIIKLALKYPPRTRALLGALFSKLNYSIQADILKISLNPLSEYNFNIDNKVLETASNWNIV